MQRNGNVPGLVRVLREHDWVEGTDGRMMDLAISTRIAAATALVDFDDDLARTALIEALGDPDLRLRAAVVEETASQTHPELSAGLAIALARWSDAPPELYERAVEILEQRRDPWLAIFFAETLLDDKDPQEVGARQQRALAQLADVPDGDGIIATMAGRLIERLPMTADPERRRLVAVLIGFGEPAVEPLIQALDDPSRRMAAATALGGIRDERGIGPLTAMLDDPDPGLRVVAAIALGRMRHPATAEALIRASLDDRMEVRDAAQAALDQIGAAGVLAGLAAVIGPIAQRLERLEQHVSGRAVEAPTEQPNGGSGVPFLRRLLERGVESKRA